MFNMTSLKARKARFLNRWHARAATRTRAQVKGFVSSPEPRTIGSFARGRQLIAGNFLFAGTLVNAPGQSMWGIEPPDANYAAELQGFSWLDDLAALGDPAARSAAQDWLWGWIEIYGKGKGPGLDT